MISPPPSGPLSGSPSGPLAGDPPRDPSACGGRLITADGRALPLREATLTAEAGGGVARVVLTQRFVNPHAETLTVDYLLPLPADAAISGFSFVLGDRRIVGEIDGRARARARFERALLEGRGAALLEQQRSSVFCQTIGNLPPGAEILTEVTLDQPLRWLEEGAWEWRFPTVVGPRYLGAPGRVADAAALHVDVIAPDDAKSDTLRARARARLTIDDALIDAPSSSSHALRHEQARGRTQVLLDGDGDGVALDRDLVIRWSVARPQVGAASIAARPGAGALATDNFALLTLVPPRPGSDMRPLPRDLIILLDTSGSMDGRPLDQAKRLIGAMIAGLGDADRLELIEFSSQARRFRGEPIVTDAAGKRAALAWLEGLRAGGSTEMHQAVLAALRPLRAEAQRQVLLITDGQIGFEQEILRALLDELPAGVRLHTVGVGAAINRSLTAAAARAGRGSELIVDLDEDVERVVPRLLARTAAPLVTDLQIEGEALLAVAPRALPDLHAGSPTLISLRLRGPGPVRVRGRCAVGHFDHWLQVPALEPGEGPAGVVALHGREVVEDLELELAARGHDPGIDDAIEAIGLRFAIATRLTSWIAVTKARVVDPELASRRQRQPQELPYGASIEGLGLRAPEAALPKGGLATADDDFFSDLGGLEEAPLVVREREATGARADRTRAGGVDPNVLTRQQHAHQPAPLLASPPLAGDFGSRRALKTAERRSTRGWLVVLFLLLLFALITLVYFCAAPPADQADPPSPPVDAPTSSPAGSPHHP